MTTAPAKAGWRFRQPSVIPGFGLTLGFSLAYLTLIILIPLSGLIWRSGLVTKSSAPSSSALKTFSFCEYDETTITGVGCFDIKMRRNVNRAT